MAREEMTVREEHAWKERCIVGWGGAVCGSQPPAPRNVGDVQENGVLEGGEGAACVGGCLQAPRHL